MVYLSFEVQGREGVTGTFPSFVNALISLKAAYIDKKFR